MVLAFDCIFVPLYVQPLTGLWGAGNATVSTDMEALTGFGGMGFGGTDIGGGAVRGALLISRTLYPRKHIPVGDAYL
jgi:hypothetical protein